MRISVTLPDEIYTKLKQVSILENRSMANVVRMAITHRINIAEQTR